MDRKTAFEILGLKESSTPDEMQKRMNVLYKKFKQVDRDERGYTLADIDEAYKTVSGIAYYDEKAEQEKKYRKEHPNPVFKLLGVDEEKARNLIYYYKWHAIIAIAVIVAVVSTIISIVTKVEPDLKLLIAGDIFVDDTMVLEERIENEVDGVTEALVQNIYLSEKSNPQIQMAMQTKFVVELSAGKNDLYILDEEKYFELAKQGAFRPVEDVLGDLSALGIETEDHEDLKVALESGDGIYSEPQLFGLDVTDSKLLKECGLNGGRFIAAFGISGKGINNAVELVKIMVK